MGAIREAIQKRETPKENNFISQWMAPKAEELLGILAANPVIFKVDITCPIEFSAQMEEWLRLKQTRNMVGLNPEIPELGPDIFYKARVYMVDKTHFEVNYYCKDESALDNYLIPNAIAKAIGAAMPNFMKEKDKNNIQVTRQKGLINEANSEYQWSEALPRDLLFEEWSKFGYSVYDTHRQDMNDADYELMRRQPIIYNVALNIKEGKREEVEQWLINEHVDEIVNLDKDIFFAGNILRTNEGDNITIQYSAKNEQSIQTYIDQHATQMRSKIPERLQGAFTAIRTTGIVKNGKYERSPL